MRPSRVLQDPALEKAPPQSKEDSDETSEESDDSSSEIVRNVRKKKAVQSKKKQSPKSSQTVKLACKFCKKTFPLYPALVRHTMTHKPYYSKCKLCGMTETSHTAFVLHMKRNHPEVNVNPCTFPSCEESFRTKKQLRDHENVHYKFVCRFCKRRFIKKLTMRAHVSKYHAPEE